MLISSVSSRLPSLFRRISFQNRRLITPMYTVLKYQHPINLDGQSLPLSLFPDRKDLIGKIISVTISGKHQDRINIDDEDIISKQTQPVYARRDEEVFAEILNVYRGYQVKAKMVDNPLISSNSKVMFFVHNTKSTPYFTHSTYISKIIRDEITMTSDLITYFKQTNTWDELKDYEDDEKMWLDQSFLDRIDKNPTKQDLDVLDYLLKKDFISQDLYEKYLNDYIPFNNICQTVLNTLDGRKSMKHQQNPYDPQFDHHENCLSKCFSSYGYANNHLESRFFRSGDLIDITLENIHYVPLELNHMHDYQKYRYTFAKIPKPMSWSGALFEDRDAILSSLKVGNTVRCIFEKQLIENDGNSQSGGGAWYFDIIQIIDQTIYGILNDLYYEPKDYQLNQGDILIFKKENVSEIPHTWSTNKNLKYFNTSNVGYVPTGCVHQVNHEPEDHSSTTNEQTNEN